MASPNIARDLQRVPSQEDLAEMVKNLNAALYAALGYSTSAIDTELKRELGFRKRVFNLFANEEFQTLLEVSFLFVNSAE